VCLRHTFDAPAKAVPTQTLVSLLDGGDRAGGQQEPLDGFDIGWGRAFPYVYHPQRDRRFVLVRRWRGDLDFPIAQDPMGRALLALCASLLLAFLRAGALPRNLDAQLAFHGALSDGSSSGQRTESRCMSLDLWKQ